MKKLINTVIVALALTGVTVSCQKQSVSEQQTDSQITVDRERIVNCTCEAGVVEIPYSVTGASAGLCPRAIPDVDWLIQEESTEEGIILFSLTENRSPEDRTGRITLSLSGAKPVKLTVIQAADSDYKVNPALSFTLNVSEVSYSSADIEITPSDNNSYYYYGVVEASLRDSFATEEAFLEANTEAIEETARKYAEKYGREYSLEPYLNKGYVKTTLSSLKSETAYVLTVFDMSLSGEYSGRLFQAYFTTGRIPASSAEFNIIIDESAYTLTVSPTSAETGTYAVEILSKADWQRYSSPKKCAESFLDYISSSGNNVSAYLHSGEFATRYYIPSSQGPSMTSGDYVAYAFATDGVRVQSGVSYTFFHFEEPQSNLP